MPATVTHAYFAMDIYHELPIGLKKLLMDEKAHLRMFAQSMDALYFYKIFWFGKGKRQRQFGYYFHQHHTQAFFLNLVNYIKYNQLYKQADVMAFLYGMISHYVLDSKLHPFVIYQTGWYHKEKKETRKYRNLHDEAETYMDLFLISQREKKAPYLFRLDQYCFDLTPFSPSLKEVINYTYQETFGIKKMDKFYFQALKEMKFFLKWVRYDRFGMKQKIYSTFEFLTARKTFHFHVLSYHLPRKCQEKYLNLNHETWYHPSRKQEKHKESFLDLYDQAKKEALQMIKEVNFYLQDKKKIDLKQVFPNHSYLSGKECEKNYPYRYFKENT